MIVSFIMKMVAWKNAEFILRIRSYLYFRKFSSFVYKRFSLFGNSEHLKIGDDVRFYPNCILELGHCAELKIGDGCVFAYGVLIACHKKVILGKNVLIGEYSSVRDTSHQYSTNLITKNSIDISDDIIIGDNVWIGRGCIVLPGTLIESNSVFASNSVIKGYYSGSNIYGGNRARLIKSID